MKHRLRVEKQDLQRTKKLSAQVTKLGRYTYILTQCLLACAVDRQYEGFETCGVDNLYFSTGRFEIDDLGKRLIKLWSHEKWNELEKFIPCTVTFE